MNFLTQIDNLALLALLIISGITLFLPTLSTLISGKGLSPTEATIWINRRKAYVLDLRAEQAYKIGHLPNARHFPLDEMAAGLEKLKLDRKLPVILICENGANSRKAVSALQKAGFLEVAALEGGLKSWQAAALPLVK